MSAFGLGEWNMNRKCCSANLVFQNTTVMRRQRQKRTTRHGSGRGRTAATWPGRAKEAQIRDTVKCILSHKNHHHFVTSFFQYFCNNFDTHHLCIELHPRTRITDPRSFDRGRESALTAAILSIQGPFTRDVRSGWGLGVRGCPKIRR